MWLACFVYGILVTHGRHRHGAHWQELLLMLELWAVYVLRSLHWLSLHFLWWHSHGMDVAWKRHLHEEPAVGSVERLTVRLECWIPSISILL